MQNVKITSRKTEAKSAYLSQATFNSLPPTSNWSDRTLAYFFGDDRPQKKDALEPFDYEAFLREEGLSC